MRTPSTAVRWAVAAAGAATALAGCSSTSSALIPFAGQLPGDRAGSMVPDSPSAPSLPVRADEISADNCALLHQPLRGTSVAVVIRRVDCERSQLPAREHGKSVMVHADRGDQLCTLFGSVRNTGPRPLASAPSLVAFSTDYRLQEQYLPSTGATAAAALIARTTNSVVPGADLRRPLQPGDAVGLVSVYEIDQHERPVQVSVAEGVGPDESVDGWIDLARSYNG